MPDEYVKQMAKETLDWADNLSDVWVGTTTANVICYKKKHVEELMGEKQYNLASIAVLELAETCRYAQKELDEHTKG